LLKVHKALVAAVAAAAFAAPTTASADLFDSTPLAGSASAPVAYTSNDGSLQVLTFAASTLTSDGNQQKVVGTFADQAFTGLIAFHDYDRASQTGHYSLSGSLGAAGAPMLADISLTLDRLQATYTVAVSGTVGGQALPPLGGVSVTNPFYGNLGLR
jgi:hypothetical protein